MCLEITYQHLPVGTQLMHEHHLGELCLGCLEFPGRAVASASGVLATVAVYGRSETAGRDTELIQTL